MRIEQLTFTRFIAALLIVVFHFGSGSLGFTNPYTQFLFQQANIGVSYFFILSGFVMVIAYHNKAKISFKEYIVNRFARVYPIYFFSMLMLFALYFISSKLDYLNLILNVFMIQAWVPGKALVFNIAAWSLSVELLFYLLFPFLFNKVYTKVRFNKLMAPIFLFWLVSQFLYHYFLNQTTFTNLFYSSRDIMYHPIFHLNEFIIGNLAGLYFIKNSSATKNYDAHIIIVLVLILIALKYPIGLSYHNGLLAILFIPMILLLSLNKGCITKLFNKKAFVFLGEISYSLYICQFIVWIYISDYRLEKYFGLDKVEDFLFCFFLRFFILISLSVLSYLYIEKPARNRIKIYNTNRRSL